MDSRLLQYYNQELHHLRSSAGEFAREFPKVAGRLSLDEFDCGDPYVERLLEGFAFLAARVQLKLDAEFPQFTQSILETVYPNYLSPVPSMAVVEYDFDVARSDLVNGFEIKRDAVLRSVIGNDTRTACEYRPGHSVTLWPIEVVQADYFARDLSSLKLPDSAKTAKAAIRIRLQTPPEILFSDLKLDELTFYVRGPDDLPNRIYEQLFAHGTNVLVQSADNPSTCQCVVPTQEPIKQVGYSDEEALLPVVGRSFRGYRLLREYFAFPQRLLFFRLDKLRKCIQQCDQSAIDLVILLDREALELEGRVEAGNFVLHCAPVINLFPKRADVIHLSDKFTEHHVVPNRTRPMDYEVYQVLDVTGYGVHADEKRKFAPFYSASDFNTSDGGAFFTVSRSPRTMSSRENARGRRSRYGGSEVFLSIVDAAAAPYHSSLRQLSIQTLCTNRDLPIQMPVGQGKTDFNLDVSSPVESIRCIAGPTAPRPSNAEGEISWRIINHLNLNYLSLVDNSNGKGSAAIRDMLRLYCDANDLMSQKQIEGVLAVNSRPITRRIIRKGQIAFVRGLEVTVEFDEVAFEGTGVFLLGAVMNAFFSRYVSINSFTETVITSRERGEIMRWQANPGAKHTL